MKEAKKYWVGLDVSASSFDAAVASPDRHANASTFHSLPTATFERTPQGVQSFVCWLRTLVPSKRPLPVRAVMEATGMYSIELAAMLSKVCPEIHPAIANPERTSAFRKSLGLRNKTDRMDARALAFFGLERRPDPYEPLSPAQAELRSLSRCRDDLVKTQTAHESQLMQSGNSTLVRNTLKHVIRTIKTALGKLEHDMKRIIGSNEGFRHDYDLLTSIPGVGFVTACVVLAEFGDLRRFGRSRQIGAHAGLSAFHNDSGKQTPPAHMSKKGNAYVRKILYMSAISASRYNPPLRRMYCQMIAAGKQPMVALGAIMRKLLVLMRALVITETPFDPSGKPPQFGPEYA